MQDRYVGDEGDFVKFYLLNNLCETNLRLGVNWCLVTDENHNKDGKFVSYLSDKHHPFNNIDSRLFEKLKEIVHGVNKNVECIEKSEILPSQTLYFSEKILADTARFQWHDSSVQHLQPCDIVFYDPDNGLEIGSIGKLHQKAIKYIYFDEIRDTFKNGKSIVIYQHTNRTSNSETQIESRIKQLSSCLSISKNDINVIYSGHGTARYFLIIKQKQHVNAIDKNIKPFDNKFLKLIC